MMTPTPTTNATLPFRVSGFATLAEGLDYAARGRTGCNFFSARGELQQVLPYRELRERARDLAARLAGLDLARGSRVALIAETSPEFLEFFFACQYAGLIPVPLPLAVNFGGRDAYVERLRRMLQTAEARVAIASADLVATLRAAAAGTAADLVGTPDQFKDLPRSAAAVRPLGADEPCYIQFSSGSTSLPRGVLVTQQAVADNAAAIAEHGLRLTREDRCVSWLPLYHDMGLVGCCLTPVLTQITVDYIPTTGFVRRPLTWLKVISEQRGTISFAPTFGYELCARRAENADPAAFDLGSWRVAGIGGEMIRVRALQEFAERFAPAGFRPTAFLPSYGLAEATLAVTFSTPGEGVQVDRVRCGAPLERDRRAVPAPAHGEASATRARSFAVCGRPMPRYRVEIRDDRNCRLPDRVIGRVCIQGPSLMRGYFRDLQATRSVVTADGWLDTGDMGYLIDGQLVITGRSKDLIIFNGRNIWPQDLEWAIERLEPVRSGDVAAFSVNEDDDRERVVVVVECRSTDPAARRELRQMVRATVQKAASVDCEVVLAPPGSLTFTTSGKLSRAAAKANYLSGAIKDVATLAEDDRRGAEVFAVAS
ncbi:MAG TPA: fatty acyl-AMP ligase [Geminicoccaceae bacterium]|nr:fatty acyl-AMP ligase [Geminicoccaceae bacterium]